MSQSSLLDGIWNMCVLQLALLCAIANSSLSARIVSIAVIPQTRVSWIVREHPLVSVDRRDLFATFTNLKDVLRYLIWVPLDGCWSEDGTC